jgi:Tol biopolymer transport system component/C-terminal processing protease CtpA/Prc
MKRALALLLFAASMNAAPPMLHDPALSPDNKELAFVSGGDIWVAPASGGEAHLLVSNPATESRPLYSPDGKKLAFVSDRTGNGDIYVLDLGSGALTRITYDSASEVLDGWSRDGEWIYFSSGAQEISGMNDVFRVRAGGGTPAAVSNDHYTNEFFSAPSPDGKRIALCARGVAAGQWWRHGHSHLDESELWLRDDAGAKQLTPRGAKHLWPMWSRDGVHLFYMSDESGAENLWSLDVGAGVILSEAKDPGVGLATSGSFAALRPLRMTRFENGRVLWPSIAYDGSAIVFERDFRIWRFDTKTNEAKPLDIALRGVAAGPGVEHRTLSSNLDELALSPDSKKAAFVVHGEVFAAPASDLTNARRITNSAGAEEHLDWSPDGRKLVYSSERDGALSLYLYDFATNSETRLTTGSASDFAARFAPDGKSIAFVRNGNELRAIGPDGKNERLIASAFIDIKPPLNDRYTIVWSPDSKWIAFLANGDRLFRNVFVIPSGSEGAGGAGGAPRAISFLGNTGADTLTWSPDGRTIFFQTNQRTEPGAVARIDLLPRVPKFREDQFRDLFKEETPPSLPKKDDKSDSDKTPAAPAPAAEKKSKDVEIVFAGIARRLTLLPVGVSVNAVSISPDGKNLLLTAEAAGQSNLYIYSLDELSKEPAVARQITSTSTSKRSAQWSSDSKEVWYLDDRRPMKVAIDGGRPSPVAVSAEMDVDFDQEKLVMFDEAWTWMRDNFHDPKMHGVDWDAERAEIEPRVAAARTYDEVRRLLSLMIGELNASHLGARGSSGRSTTGRLGLRFDRAALERDGRFVISEVVPLSPAAVTRKINVGDTLVAVDGTDLTKAANLERLLDFRVGKQVRLSILPSGGTKKDVEVQPIDLATEKQLLYRAWVQRNREYVRNISNGRIGYVHMFDMSSDALDQLAVDLDAENATRDGVIVDVRNNNGGFVNAYALDIFTRKPYLNMTFRDHPTASARTLLGQRALQRPTVLITNQHSLSDAEDFSEGYRALGLGKIVGEPTGGWIIYTSNQEMIDGSTFRLPFITITTEKGEPMEMHPRGVDVPVTRPLGEDAIGKDSQLDAAVKELMK